MKKKILCFGDSNTHGYCADPSDCEDSWGRFSWKERWTGRLQEQLGEGYELIEEGLSGRTTVFADPFESGLCGMDYLLPCMKSHQPLDLLVMMLGTNDCKERFSASSACITMGMSKLVQAAKLSASWREAPQILLLAPPAIGQGILQTPYASTMGKDCVVKSQDLGLLYQQMSQEQGVFFLDMGSLGEVFNHVDYMHLTQEGHKKFAQALGTLIPQIL